MGIKNHKVAFLLLVKKLIGATLLMILVSSVSAEEGIFVAAYPEKGSVRVGETLNIHVSSNAGTVKVNVARVQPVDNKIVIADSIVVYEYSVPAEDAWRKDHRWPVALAFTVPDDWEPGLYLFDIQATTDPGNYERFHIVVQPEELGTYGKVAVLTNDSTGIAYNTSGGKNNYKSLIPGDPGMAKVLAINRPGNFNYSHKGRDLHFPKWAQTVGMPIEYLTSLQLHFEPGILDAYDVLVLSGHSEYWSREMRTSLESFLDRGGKLVSLSGNTMWWVVRFIESEEGILMVSCKGWGVSLEPELCSDDPDLVTKYWHEFDPEIKLFGASWRYGGYVDSHGYYTREMGYGGYFAEKALHWFWAGTGVLAGDHVGQAAGIAGYEADAPPLKIVGDSLVIDPMEGLPANMDLLGTTPAARPDVEGYGAIVYFPYGDYGGEVFNCGSTDCAYGLPSDTTWHKSMLNVFKKFGAISATPTDFDLDGIDDANDNCIIDANPKQIDSFGDGTGDMCDQHCH